MNEGARNGTSWRWAIPVIVILFSWTLTTHGKPSISGDEPHYLIVDESLVSDHDLDLRNNYAAGDSRRFGAEGLEAGPHARPMRTGALWSVHDIGLPVLLLPIYAAATRLAALVPPHLLAPFRQTPGHFAYATISCALIVLAAWGAAMLFAGLRRIAPTRTAAGVVLALMLAPPVLPYTFLVFPELPAFVITCGVVWALCADELTTTELAALVAALGVMPWFHRKYSFLVLALLWLLFRRHRASFTGQTRPGLVALALLFVGPQILLHAWTLRAWGNIGGPQMLDSVPFTLHGFWIGSVGLLFDREHGLFAYAPVYLLIPVCWALTWRRHWDLLVAVLALYLPMAAFADWTAGYAPASRYLVVLTPLLTLPVADAMASRRLRRLAIPLVLFEALITGYVWQHPRALWPHYLDSNRALDAIPLVGPLYARALPSMATSGSLVRGWACAAVVAIATAAVVWYVRRGSRQATATTD